MIVCEKELSANKFMLDAGAFVIHVICYRPNQMSGSCFDSKKNI